ncbi:MAG: glyoxalase/bleomycin resistance/dioxygenase family protein [Bacteroidetes bacterium]|nr:glyoxalase/bleomycin resistance/dioxygenase family protein [Bacteroidota bacterium]MBP1617920.1 glyoxalase/bleomycin resistance/dioxygenase family protein [Bacteroidota bacterium]
MKYICPLITVSDLKLSRDFYEKLLKQKVKYDFGENVTFYGDFAIHLRSHFKELIDNREIRQGGNNFELYFEYDNVEQIVESLKEENILFVHEIREQPWRQKVVRFYDPDKNIIEIGESIEHLAFRLQNEGLSIEQISETTNMSLDFVNESIKKFNEKRNPPRRA